MCRYCYKAIYFTGVLYRLKHGSQTYVCFGAASPDGMHARYWIRARPGSAINPAGLDPRPAEQAAATVNPNPPL